MRPEILFPLFAPVTSLPGVGPRLGKLLARVAGETVASLLWHLPQGVIDRSLAPPLAQAEIGALVTLTLTVDFHAPRQSPRLPYKVRCHDQTGSIVLVFFNARPDYLKKTLPEGQVRVVSGRLERYGDQLQMTHPDYIVGLEDIETVKGIEPVYPMTTGLTPKIMGKTVRAALERLPDLPEWVDPAHRTQRGWPGWRESILAAHRPQSQADLDPASLPRQRLAYDELLASQLALALVRAQQRRLPGRTTMGDGRLRGKVLAHLPYTLTNSQEVAVGEIVADMAGASRMLRLLQGDVGSGKTVVALLAMLNAAEAGAQAALLAPTEILARQHFGTIGPLAAAAGIKVALLTGRDKGKARSEILTGLASGALPLVVGTHALVQEGVEFRDLALAVIDEQHRFGVHQRVTLAEKGRAVDVLVMTATPIPRSLMLAAYGDLDVSRLTEKPPGRLPVDTRALPLERLGEVVAAIGRAIGGGDRVYWVCPLVEESEELDLAAASERHAHLGGLFKGQVGLVHGRLRGSGKDAVMQAFAAGRIDILVATTVVEVGVDVPEATIMVIEHAERFGLAQLHQLRGRVGRGERRSTCLMLYQAPLGATAKARIAIMRETEDGFRIAEEDLKLRGAGEVLGTRQSGMPDFRLADLAVHGDLLATARDDARLLLDRDPELAGPRGESLRVLLYLFERDAVVKTVRSG